MSYQTVYSSGISSSPGAYVSKPSYDNSAPLESVVQSTYQARPEMNHLSSSTGIYTSHLDNHNEGIYQADKEAISEAKKQNSMLYKITNYSMEEISKENQIFEPIRFVNPDAPKTKFIKASEEIQGLVEEIFEKIMDSKLPNFNIMVCDQEEFVRQHNQRGGSWQQGVVGFAVHSENRIFVVENNMVELLLTIGHEIGHLMSAPLPNLIDEEAKAFAFSRVFAETIHKEDIGGLKKHIRISNPASNGIHDVADNFVVKLMEAGRSAMEVFESLISRVVSIN